MANKNDPDLAILITGSARVVADRLGAAVERAGFDDMQARFGFVVRALAGKEPRTLTDLAAVLDVSKQAAIKVVDEMEARGFLVREADPDDRRRKVLRLTDKAQAVRRTAMAATREIERELRGDLGDADVEVLRKALLGLLDRHGALDDAVAGRSRALWG